MVRDRAAYVIGLVCAAISAPTASAQNASPVPPADSSKSAPVAGADATATYYPPPEMRGGWRALVAPNVEPSSPTQQRIRHEAGLDWDRLHDAWQYAQSFGGPNSVLVIRHGWIAAEWFTDQNRRGIASCTKSFTGLSISKLCELSAAGQFDQKIDFDTPVWRYLPEEWSAADPRRKEIAIRHILTMSSGLDPYDGPYQDLDAYADIILTRNVEASPGTVWAYASAPVDLLSLVVENVSGKLMGDFFNEQIGRQIGAGKIEFPQFHGHSGGSGGPRGGVRIAPRDLARLGYLLLQNGQWVNERGETQVLSPESVQRLTHWAPQLESATYREPNYASEKGAQSCYGSLFWTNRSGQLGPTVPEDCFYMSGWGKQACWVIPSLDMVVVRLGPNRDLNGHPEYYPEFLSRIVAAVVDRERASGPWIDGRFRGRIAYSCDGNHNDPDDWAASPVALAILAECGLRERLVHFDYNSILTDTNKEWEQTHADSVLGAGRQYGYDPRLFFDCRQDLEGTVDSIEQAINASSADDPLYFVIAGPMEVPWLGIQRSDPARREFVYCISHSRWNDGFAPNYRFTHSKRDVIDSGVHWVQIQDQNRLLSTSRYGRPAQPAEWRPWEWMRDSPDERVRFLWERLQISQRPDPSDAGMAYFLATGDDEADPAKLQGLFSGSVRPVPVNGRTRVRLEAENFQRLDGFDIEDRNDRDASQRLNLRQTRDTATLSTRIVEPYIASRGRYDVDVRFSAVSGTHCRLTLLVNGKKIGETWEAGRDGWTTHTLAGLPIAIGDEIRVDAAGAGCRLDYVQLNLGLHGE